MTLSPDGHWFWNGTEWIPAPPSAAPETDQHQQDPNAGKTEATATNPVNRPDEVQASLDSVESYCNFVNEYILKNTVKDEIYVKQRSAYILSMVLAGLVCLATLWYTYSNIYEYQQTHLATALACSYLPLVILPVWHTRKLRRHLNSVFDNGGDLVYGRKSIKFQKQSFLENLAVYDFLIHAASSLNDLSLSKELITVQSTLEQMKEKIKSQEVTNAVIKSAAAGAVAYGVAKSLSKK